MRSFTSARPGYTRTAYRVCCVKALISCEAAAAAAISSLRVSLQHIYRGTLASYISKAQHDDDPGITIRTCMTRVYTRLYMWVCTYTHTSGSCSLFLLVHVRQKARARHSLSQAIGRNRRPYILQQGPYIRMYTCTRVMWQVFISDYSRTRGLYCVIIVRHREAIVAD